jgi:hypothetical protein
MESAVEMPKGKRERSEIDLTYILLLVRVKMPLATFIAWTLTRQTRAGLVGLARAKYGSGSRHRSWEHANCHVKSQLSDAFSLTASR